MAILKAYLVNYDFSELGNNITFLFGDCGCYEFSIRKFKNKEVLNKAFRVCSDFVNKDLKHEEVLLNILFSQDENLEPVLEDIIKIYE